MFPVIFLLLWTAFSLTSAAIDTDSSPPPTPHDASSRPTTARLDTLFPTSARPDYDVTHQQVPSNKFISKLSDISSSVSGKAANQKDDDEGALLQNDIGKSWETDYDYDENQKEFVVDFYVNSGQGRAAHRKKNENEVLKDKSNENKNKYAPNEVDIVDSEVKYLPADWGKYRYYNSSIFSEPELKKKSIDDLKTNSRNKIENSDVYLDNSDLNNWKKILQDKYEISKPFKSRVDAVYKSGNNNKQSQLLKHLPSKYAASSNLENLETLPSFDLDNEIETESAEIRDLTLKKWLKTSSKSFSSNEEEQRNIAELSYKILSQVSSEENAKDEANDKEIFKAVFTSMAAYQIRKLQRKLRK